MKRFLFGKRFFLATLLLAALAGGAKADNDYGLPTNIQEGNILHCFDWTMNDVKAELPAIAEAGFGSVQLSPLQRAVGTTWPWYDAYRPYDFKFIASAFGTADDLKSLCAEAAKYGIKIVVDVVFNHVDSNGYHDTWWDSNGRLRWDGNIDYSNRYSITHGQLGGAGGYPDVNSEGSDVASRAKSYIEELKSYGVKGIRFDAAKHIALPSESCNFWSTVCSVSGMYYYGEILDNPGGNGDALMKEYTNYMSVTDNGYGDGARANGGVPESYAGWGSGTISQDKCVYWGESHDTYANDGGASKNVDQGTIDRAYAIVSCRKEAAGLYLSRPNTTQKTAMLCGQKGSTHFKEKCVAEVNKFRNAMVGTADYYSKGNGAACVTRQGGGAVIVKNGGGGYVSVTNGASYVPSGTYTDRVSGNTFTVTSSTISGNVGSSGIAVIYEETNPKPAMTLSPSGGSFKTETLSITATLKNATSGTIKVGDGAAETFTSTKTITIGADMAYGDTKTITWTATGTEGTTSGSATYKKVDPSAGITVYVSASSAPYLYAWTGDGDTANKLNGDWPGKQLSETTTYGGKTFYYQTFTDLESFNIIFNNGAGGTGNQTADITGITSDVYYLYDGGSTATVYSGGGDDPSPTPTPSGDYPSTLYLIGNLNSWGTSTAVAATGNNGIYTWTSTNLPDAGGADAGKSFFTFITTTGANWDAVNQADRYGASSKDELIAVGSSATITKYPVNVSAMGALSWYTTPGTYTVTANLQTMTVSVSSPTGIGAIDADNNANAPMYNLSGQRVGKGYRGIVIQNGKKRVIK